jgi:6-phosphofructokinase 2
VTLTLNPALDVSSSVEAMAHTHKLRCTEPIIEPGGGGINVARVCQQRGVPITCVVAAGGPNGLRLTELLSDQGLSVRPISLAAETRQNLAVHEDSTGEQYRFVFPGPALSGSELGQCLEQVALAAESATCVVISGSPPANGDGGIVARIVEATPHAKVIVDTVGSALRDALQSGCYLAKPSARELASLVGRELPTEADIASAAEALMATSNLEHLVVSLGAGGVFAVSTDGTRHRVRAPAVDVRSAIGAGDAMVAGLAIGTHEGLPFRECLMLGIAFGTAAVLTPGSQLCEPGDVERLLPMVMCD